jgi:2-desacetyl-2-hydroxyethyl bacteriochlorophyllide A dehydrogenase
MKAAVFHEVGRPLSIEEVDTPMVGDGEVLIRVHCCGVCGSDLHATHPGAFLVPDGTVLGHEFCGDIVESSVSRLPVNTLVTAIPNNACEECKAAGFGRCKRGLGMLCPKNSITGFSPNYPGAFAEFVKCNADEVIPIPGNVGSQFGAIVEPLAVGVNAVAKGRVLRGEKVLILGGGPIGITVAAASLVAGASHVVVSEYSAHRRAIAENLGATATIDPAANDIGETFVRLTGGQPHVIFECVGIPGMIQSCVTLSQPRGRIVVVGVCMVTDALLPMAACFKDLNIQFVMGYQPESWTAAVELLDSGKVDPSSFITDVISLEELPQAFEALRKPTTQIKVMVDLLVKKAAR